MIRAITDKKEWESFLYEVEDYDFYHTYDYHDTLKKKDEVPILIIYKESDFVIGLPFLKRSVDEVYYDLTSVHGYLGPISKSIDESFSSIKFKEELILLLTELKIVSVFSKLNPYIDNQKLILSSTGTTSRVGEIIYFDQLLNDEIQIKGYNRNTRQKLKQLQKVTTIKFAETQEEIMAFIDLYHKGLDRLNAQRLFYFGSNYFQSLLTSKFFKADILLAINKETNEIMGGVFCVKTKKICHIELACTNEVYYRHSPVRILFDFARSYYKDNQIKFLNLGGGSGGREGSLMKFKTSFTKCFVDFHVWKLVVIPQVYTNLLNDLQKESDLDFFPKYRLQL